jgi:hypothetical protein
MSFLHAVISAWLRTFATVISTAALLAILAWAALILDMPRIMLFIVNWYFVILYVAGILAAGFFATKHSQPRPYLAAAVAGGVFAIVLLLALRQASPLSGSLYMAAGAPLAMLAAWARLSIPTGLMK